MFTNSNPSRFFRLRLPLLAITFFLASCDATDPKSAEISEVLIPYNNSHPYELTVIGEFTDSEVQTIVRLTLGIDAARKRLESEPGLEISSSKPNEAQARVGVWPAYYVDLSKSEGIWSVNNFGPSYD